MKKTIIALLALGYTAAAAEDPFDFSSTSASDIDFSWKENGVTKTATGRKVTLENEYDLSKDWTLTFTCTATPLYGTTAWGTSIICTEDNPLADKTVFQLYATIGNAVTDGEGNPDGDANAIVKANTNDYGKKSTTIEGWNMEAMNGPTVFTFDYDSTTKELTFHMNNYEKATYENVSFEGCTLSQLTTSITADQLAKKDAAYGMFPAWTLPTGTFTGTVLTIPEPTTATLSLLALAGLAARRRRR